MEQPKDTPKTPPSNDSTKSAENSSTSETKNSRSRVLAAFVRDYLNPMTKNPTPDDQ